MDGDTSINISDSTPSSSSEAEINSQDIDNTKQISSENCDDLVRTEQYLSLESNEKDNVVEIEDNVIEINSTITDLKIDESENELNMIDVSHKCKNYDGNNEEIEVNDLTTQCDDDVHMEICINMEDDDSNGIEHSLKMKEKCSISSEPISSEIQPIGYDENCIIPGEDWCDKSLSNKDNIDKKGNSSKGQSNSTEDEENITESLKSSKTTTEAPAIDDVPLEDPMDVDNVSSSTGTENKEIIADNANTIDTCDTRMPEIEFDDVEVSVFDEGTTDNLTPGFLRSTNKPKDAEFHNPAVHNEDTGFKLDDIILSSDDESSHGSCDNIPASDKVETNIDTLCESNKVNKDNNPDEIDVEEGNKLPQTSLSTISVDSNVSPCNQENPQTHIEKVSSSVVAESDVRLIPSDDSRDIIQRCNDNDMSIDVEESLSSNILKKQSGSSSEKIEDSQPKDTPGSSNCSSEPDILDVMRAALLNNENFRKDMDVENPENDTDDPAPEKSIEPEVISLDDDDEDSELLPVIKKKTGNSIFCVNPNCESGEELAKPAMFVLTYFGLKLSKDQQVCAKCFNAVVEHQANLAQMLNDGTPLFEADFPLNKDIILLDSDEEGDSDNESELSEGTMEVIRDNIDDVIEDTVCSIGLDGQIQDSCRILNAKLDAMEEDTKEIDKSFSDVQRSLDNIRKLIYADFKYPMQEFQDVHVSDCEIPPMPILKSKLHNILYAKELQVLRKSKQREREMEAQRASASTAASAGASGSPLRGVATKRVSHTSLSQPRSPMAGGHSSANDVIAVARTWQPPPKLPPTGQLVRPKLRESQLVYTMKISQFSIWVPAQVIEVIPRIATEVTDCEYEEDIFVVEVIEVKDEENDPATETYRVRLDTKKNSVRMVTGRYLAYWDAAPVQLPVGTRVIAVYREEEDGMVTSLEKFYVGVVAEPMKSINEYRYLVFFDDGYTQYCPHENIRVVCATSKNVWEDIHPEPREFVRKYLQQYPERPMVKLGRGQVVRVEWNGRWWIVRVQEVDASLVKVHFDADNRTEWIYRGSTRLWPMFAELAAAKERQSGSLLRSRGFGTSMNKGDLPYVEYTRGEGEEKKDDDKEAPPPRSVARKSTAKKPEPAPAAIITNQTFTRPLLNYVPKGNVMIRLLDGEHRPKPFRPHQCSVACVSWTNYSPTAAKAYDPLIKPLMFAFQRLLFKFDGRRKSAIMYVAPCGRRVRSSQEMLCFLQATGSLLTIDLFDYDHWVNPANEFREIRNPFVRIEDLSYGKENVPISCVNELDHSTPQYVQYMTARQPRADVHLNLDSDFLVGCDCTDDCEDRDKCSCWQLTMQGKAYIPDGDLDPLFGYQFRRLPERIATGIYECNSQCKCAATCQNRVAQQPLSVRLQLFKTLRKGWGIRSLHDIPRGAFICIYAGFLLTEQEANEGGKTYGDEYLAELDYIESVENLKEGYESEAREFSEDEMTQPDSQDMEYEEEERLSPDSDDDPAAYRRLKHDDMKLRPRKRTNEESDQESTKKSKEEDDTISISDDEPEPARQPHSFSVSIAQNSHESKYPSVRELYSEDECVYIMDAKTHGNIGRYLNHSCSPNVFVQNVFVDTHDLRFPWVAFFANQYIPAGTELTWDYNYDVGSVPGKQMFCYCGSDNCRGRLL